MSAVNQAKRLLHTVYPFTVSFYAWITHVDVIVSNAQWNTQGLGEVSF